MKSVILLVALVAAVNAVPPAALAGFMGADTTLWTDFKCRDGVLGPNDDRMKDVGACAANDCTFFCHAKALGLLSKDGVPKSEIYDKWSEQVLPERHHQVAKAWFRDCYTKYGKSIKASDLKSGSCLYAKQMGDCTWSVQPQLTCPKA